MSFFLTCWGVGTVQVSHTENVGGTALGRTVETTAGRVGLALSQGGGQGEAEEKSGNCGGELHFGCGGWGNGSDDFLRLVC